MSAARQLVSLKMVAEPALVGELNTHLPDQIRVLGEEVRAGVCGEGVCVVRGCVW